MSSAIDKISADLKLAEFKLLDLRKSFENLKSLTSPVSSITLQWHQIETHFNSLHSSLLHCLQSLKSRQQRDKYSNNVGIESKATQFGDLTTLQSLCLNMDSEGLRLYLNDRGDEHELLRKEMSDSLKLSPNAAELVLGAVKGFYMKEELKVRKSCVLLLEELMGLSLEIESELKEEGMKMANVWKEKLVDDKSEGSVGVLGFLLFLAAFQLRKGFRKRELLGLLECVCRHKEAPALVRLLGLVKKTPKLIQNLIDKKLHIEALRFIYAFELDDKFPPVPILKDHLEHHKKIAEKIRKRNSHGSENKATAKEINSLRAVIQCITDHNLESVFSPKSLEKRIAKLEKEKHIVAAPGMKEQQQVRSEKKRKKRTSQTPSDNLSPVPSHTSSPTLSSTSASTSAPDSKAQPQRGDEYPHINLVADPIAHSGALSTIHSTQPDYWQSAAFYPDNTAINFSGPPSITQHMSLLAGSYGFSAPPAIPLHTGSTAGDYLFGFANNVNAGQYQFPGTYDALKGEKNHIPPTTVNAATNAQTPGPAPTSEAQPQQLSGNKRPRTLESAEMAKNVKVGAITTIPTEQKPSQTNASLHNNHGSQSYTGQYSLGGFPSINQHTGSYCSVPISYYPSVPGSYYPRDALNPKHSSRPVAYGVPNQVLNQHGYYNPQVSFGGYAVPTQRHPSSGANGLPPQQYPSSNP